MFIWHSTSSELQDDSKKSYVGGVPMLPEGVTVPIFDKTGIAMTFFFQIELPNNHPWEGRMISVFSATDYVDDDSFIPRLPNPLAGADLSESFFQDYQTFFRIILFDSQQGQRLSTYAEKVAFHELNFADVVPDEGIVFGEINTSPNWILEDESPSSFDRQRGVFEFLFQTKLDYEFEIVSGAPRQKAIDYERGGGLKDSEGLNYTLFTSNELYFFGLTLDGDLIYIVPHS